jgi:hypothetical protein
MPPSVMLLCLAPVITDVSEEHIPPLSGRQESAS